MDHYGFFQDGFLTDNTNSKGLTVYMSNVMSPIMNTFGTTSSIFVVLLTLDR